MDAIRTHVFLSFANVDVEVVRRLANRLETAGVAVWTGDEQLVPGTLDWEKSVRGALDASFAVVLMASPAAARSVYVRGELDIASARRLPLFSAWTHGESWAAVSIDFIPRLKVCRSAPAGLPVVVFPLPLSPDSPKNPVASSLIRAVVQEELTGDPDGALRQPRRALMFSIVRVPEAEAFARRLHRALRSDLIRMRRQCSTIMLSTSPGETERVAVPKVFDESETNRGSR